jgi:hypothetical protein
LSDNSILDNQRERIKMTVNNDKRRTFNINFLGDKTTVAVDITGIYYGATGDGRNCNSGGDVGKLNINSGMITLKTFG